jgi:HEAT repeat protein
MADSTLKRLIELIESGDAELRRAAVQVVGAVGPARDGALIKVLLAVLDEADTALRLAAIESLGRLHAETALPRLVSLVEQGGPEVEAAARAAGRLGARGTRAIERVLTQAAPVLRRRIAAAIAFSGTESAAVAAAHALLDDDPRVVDAAARSLAGEVASLSAGQRRALAESLTRSLRAKQPPLSPASEAAMLRVLTALHPAGAEEIYWSRLDPSHPAAIRAAALHALGAGSAPTSEARFQRLLACAADADFQIVAPALLMLQGLPSKKYLKCWLQLLEAPDVAARRLAVDKLKDVPSAAAARALLGQIRHPDRALRESALAALCGVPAGRQALLAALLEAATPDEAWSLARAQSRCAAELPPAARARLFEHACSYQDQDDRRAEPLWFLLREIDHDGTRDRIEERALALRKKKNYAGALAYFRLLTRDPACAEETRFEQAVTALKLAQHDASPAARQGDPVLAQLARLVQDPSFDLIGRLTRARWLEPEDLFYLGFHFAEQHHQAKELGGKILELVVQRSPRSNLAKDAKRKLKSEGLG